MSISLTKFNSIAWSLLGRARFMFSLLPYLKPRKITWSTREVTPHHQNMQ